LLKAVKQSNEGFGCHGVNNCNFDGSPIFLFTIEAHSGEADAMGKGESR
jgi:hypothetical protein